MRGVWVFLVAVMVAGGLAAIFMFAGEQFHFMSGAIRILLCAALAALIAVFGVNIIGIRKSNP
jgi:hypothetical protein